MKNLIKDFKNAEIDFEVKRIENDKIEMNVGAFDGYYDVEITKYSDDDYKPFFEISFYDFEAMNQMNEIVSIISKTGESIVEYFSRPYGNLIIQIKINGDD